MGHQNLSLLAAFMLLVATGCDSGVEMSIDPVPQNSQAEVTEPVENEVVNRPIKVLASEPIEGVEVKGLLSAKAGAHRQVEAWAGTERFGQAINQFYASNGRYPKSHEEFMKKAWEPQLMAMPKIEEGYEFRYFADDHQVYKVLIGHEDEWADSE
ncbi:hypothetical protein [Aeoliella mucimassa]|uniref:Uncharacterized protein n=1 Tax=Aeoliella mucimassa TaxID=2527972 RepID=A0A518AL02_9BACT|nr:hypothetical protein [Aeoliella mucimassa]QDU55407.1 hypothetical protein Pan181_15960 [Aeoliella mucimassa]